MADKFIPFNPETAKNGDIVHYLNNEFLFVGLNPKYPSECILLRCDGYVVIADNNAVSVKAPKKTLWVNLVKYGLCGIESSVYDCEKIAKGIASKYAGDYLGTFPIEIDDVA